MYNQLTSFVRSLHIVHNKLISLYIIHDPQSIKKSIRAIQQSNKNPHQIRSSYSHHYYHRYYELDITYSNIYMYVCMELDGYVVHVTSHPWAMNSHGYPITPMGRILPDGPITLVSWIFKIFLIFIPLA